MNQSVTAEVLVAEMFAEVSLAFLLKIPPVLVAYRQVDFEERLTVEAESVVGKDQVAGIVEVSLAFLPKVLPVLVASRQVDFEVRLAVEAGSVVGMDQAAAVDWVAAE